MHLIAFSISAILCFSGTAYGASSLQQKAPQNHPASDEDVRAQQSLGRVLLSPDGSFLLYEWGRPYVNWVPDTQWMAPNAARRMQVSLYRLNLKARDLSSELLFYPKPGASYWLGDLSPDSAHVVLYELDNDSNTVRAGVWSVHEKKAWWFSPRPDEMRIESETVWMSSDEFIYPVKEGKGFARASALTVNAELCSFCSQQIVRQALSQKRLSTAEAVNDSAMPDQKHGPPGSKLVAATATGAVRVYLTDDAEELALWVSDSDGPARVVFENRRKSDSLAGK